MLNDEINKKSQFKKKCQSKQNSNKKNDDQI
jgi:hypothetical protein